MSEEKKRLVDEEEDEDDDIPDLESVASSEYYDSDDDSIVNKNTVMEEPKSVNFIMAKKWLDMNDVDKLLKEFEVLAIYTYSPFLYGGHVDPKYWESQWFSWFRKVNLISQRPFNLDVLSIQDIRCLEILGLTLDWCIKQSQSVHASSYLSYFMDLWEEIDGNKEFEAVINIAKGKNWFKEILDMISNQPDDLGLRNEELKDQSAIELCVLYTVCHLGYQLINKSGNVTTFQEDLAHKREMVQEIYNEDIKNNLEKAEMSFIMFERLEYMEAYRNAIRLSPFDKTLYESRLQAHILSGYHLDAVSDSIRLICLHKYHKNAHMCLIKSLIELNERTRADIASAMFHKEFQSSADKELLQKFLNNKIDIIVANQPFTASSRQEFKKLQDLGEMGTKNFKSGDYENAHLYYGACLSKAREIPSWRHAVNWREGSMFILAVQYCFAQTLLSSGKHEAALENFLKLCRYHKLYPFPAAHLYSAMCSVKQRRYTKASEDICAGLELCELHGLAPLRWPGTDDPISECLPQNVKTKLLQLQAQLSHDIESLGTCRFSNCLQHNISRQIIKDDPEFKGYAMLKCSEHCSVAFHPSCWKKQKALLGYYNEKNLASTKCLTPDCPGVITYIVLFDSDNKARYEVDFKSDDESLGPALKKRKGSTSVALQRLSSSESEKAKKEPTESEKPRKDSIGEPKSKPTKQEDSKSDESKFEKLLIKEDVRKSEDSIEVINRQTEDKESKSSKSKNKKKKSKQQPKEEEKAKENGCKWDDLFTLPERKGLMNGTSSTEDVPSWEPDPDAPFSVPEHLKEKVSEFEAGELSNEISKPPLSAGVPADSNDYNFAISYFVEIFKNDGPLLNPTDSILTESLQNIPDQCKKIIELHGGIHDFLLGSPKFKLFMDGMIGLNKKYLDLDNCEFPQVIRKVDKKLSEECNHQDVPSSPSPTLKNKKGKKKNTLLEKNHQTGHHKNGNGREILLKNGNEINNQIEEQESKSKEKESKFKEQESKSKEQESKFKEQESKCKEQGSKSKMKAVTDASPTLVAKEVKKIKSKSEGNIVKEEMKQKVVTVNTAIQTETIDRFPKATNTDPMPVIESFKERYEEIKEQYDELMKEKKSLESKLDVSEDMRVKLQKQQMREIEKAAKKKEIEMKKEMDEKVSLSETLLKEEKEKFAKERKELNEIARASKNDIKVLNEKLNKVKKELQRKEKEVDDMSWNLQEERKSFVTQKDSLEEQYKTLLDTQYKRAVDAEAQLLTLRRDSYVKPTEQKLQELERLCNYASQALPGGEPELGMYKDQLKQTLDTYKAVTDEQIHKIMTRSHEINQLENVAPPVCPMSPQLRMRAQLIQRSLIMSLQRGMTNFSGITGMQSGLSGMPGIQPVMQTGLTGMQTSLPSIQPSMSSSMTGGIQPGLTGIQQQPGLNNMQTSMTGAMQTGITNLHTSMPTGMANNMPPGMTNVQTSMSTGMTNHMLTGMTNIQTSMSTGMTNHMLTGMTNNMPTGMANNMPTGMTNNMPTGMANNMPTGMANNMPTGMANNMPTGMANNMPTGMANNMPTGIANMQQSSVTSMQTLTTSIPVTTSDSLLLSNKPATIPNALPSNPLELLNQPQSGSMSLGLTSMGMGSASMGMGMGTSGPPGLGQSGVLNTPQNPNTLSFFGLNTETGMSLNAADGSKLGAIGTSMSYNNSLGIPPTKEVNETSVKSTSDKGNFDQLVETLSPLYPSYTRDDFKRAVLELRKKLSLTGLPLEAVIEKVKEIINEKETKRQVQTLASYSNLMSSLPDNFMFSQPVSNHQGPKLRSLLPTSTQIAQNNFEYSSNEDNSCIICYDDMQAFDSSKLECGHQFHTHCIRSWLNEQSTCPTCRKYALLTDDFPHLQ